MSAPNRPNTLSASDSHTPLPGGSGAVAVGGSSSDALNWESEIGPAPAPIAAKPPDCNTVFESRPPENNEAALAGMVLCYGNEPALDAISAAGLTREDFITPAGRIILAAADLHRCGRPVDLLTVQDKLTPETLAANGGPVGLSRLVDTAPPMAHAAYHLAAVRDAGAKRRLAALSDSWAQSARNGTPPADLLAQMAGAIEHEAARIHTNEDGKPVSLLALAEQEADPEEVLIGARGCRYLERGAVLMLAAPSGVGKSHLITQGSSAWSCGRTVFGLPPTAPMRCMIFQSENPTNDARVMAAAAIRGLNLTADERRLVDANTRQVWLPGVTGDAFLCRLRGYLRAWPADMVFIDPLSAFADGDLSKPETSQRFCRAGLGRLAVDCRAALFICHHVPKPNAQRDAGRTGAYDLQYAGAGSADLVANWPRAVLTLQALARGEFLLRAAKRRPPWADPDGVQRWEIGLRHTPGGLWEAFEVSSGTVAGAGRPKAPDPESYRAEALALVKKCGPQPKTVLEDNLRANVTGTRYQARAVLALLLADASLTTWRGAGRGGPSLVGLPEDRPVPEAPEGAA